jgi:DNA repair protein RecN (Recombination protein N)
MLIGLFIRDVVLIDRLDLAFDEGLSVLTGETGAGKSILLDALGLAMGARADAGLVRLGADRAVVTAEFALPAEHPARLSLSEHDIEDEDTLVLRRSLSADGRSRAFVNDRPVSAGLQRQLAESVVEVQGQFDQRGLLDAATHRDLLDAHGGLTERRAAVVQKHAVWQAARTELDTARTDLERARAEEDFLRHAAEELDTLSPRPGEEVELAGRRDLLMHAEQIGEALSTALDALCGDTGTEATLSSARRALDRVAGKSAGSLDAAVSALGRAAAELQDGIAETNAAGAAVDDDPAKLQALDDRLFALRTLARKHSVTVDGLAALHSSIADQLALLDAKGGDLAALEAAERTSWDAFAREVTALSEARCAAAAVLDRMVTDELPPLKLEKARFRTQVETLAESEWGRTGGDRVAFQVATNPGSAEGPLSKVASGGELSRFLLALKVVLVDAKPVPTLIFDEVDAGVGGAVAAAVGERLSRLGQDVQVLVVTHSPQVAAKGAAHWHVSKGVDSGGANTEGTVAEAAVTRVEPLMGDERREEIARMLSGATVTDQARAAADSLLR